MEVYKHPFKVKGERVWRTYLGGKELDKMHGNMKSKDGHFPEEWMFSVTKANNVGREEVDEGICYLEGEEKITLKELIEANPVEMLGKNHASKFNSSMGVLIKLIDSKERLTIQVHPNKEQAKKLFNSQFGKTECWHILSTRRDLEEPPCIYIGFKEGVTSNQWEDCFDRQDHLEMLSLMHKVQVQQGETYIIYGGVPHAIGAGCLIMEIQEPTDYTIRVERTTPAGFVIDDFMCHQGIGFEKMFDCFNYEGKSLEEAINDWKIEPKRVEADQGYIIDNLVGYENTECFKMKKAVVNKKVNFTKEDVFVCLYVLQGKGILTCEDKTINLEANDQVFVPACCAEYTIANLGSNSLEILECYGPEAK